MKQTLIIILLTTIFSITAKSQTTQKAEDCAECIYPDELPNHLNSNVKVVCKVIKVLQKPKSVFKN